MTVDEPGRTARLAAGMRSLFRPRSLVTLACLVIVLVGAGAGLARVRVHTDIASFLPGRDPSVQQLDQIDQKFGGEPVVVLLESAKAKQLLDQQHLFSLLELEGKLSELPDVAVVYGPATVLNQIAGQTQDLLAELSGRRDGEQAEAEGAARAAGGTKAQIAAAGKRAEDAFDARYGPLLISGLPVGLPTLHNPRFADSVIFSGSSSPRAQWRFVVPNANSVAILVRPRQGLDAAASERLVSAVKRTVASVHLDAKRTTVSGAPALVAALNADVGHELPLLGGIAIVAVALSFALVPWARRSRRLLPLASTLLGVAITLSLYGWVGRSISLGVVVGLPVLLGIGSYYPTYFARRARPRTVFVVAAGTAASFATLAVSPLPFVRDLALLLGVGVVVCAVIGWLVSWRLGELGSAATPDPVASVARPVRPAVRNGFRGGAVALAALAIAGWALLPGLTLQTDFERYAQGLPAIGQADHVESVIGSSGELDIVLTGRDVLSADAYEWMRNAQNLTISDYADRARAVVSAPTLMSFLGASPTLGEIQAGARLVPQYLLGAAVTPDRTTGVLSFGVVLSDLPAVRQMVNGLRASLPKPPAGYQVQVVGLPVVASRGADLVSGDRLLTNLLGAVTAAAVLALGLRRRGDALRALGTALTATGVGFALLRFSGLSISPLTACLGALTSAVACEFTVMLADATRSIDRRLRASVLLALATSVIGYLSLTASNLAAVREFGVLLACAVALAFGTAWCVVRATVTIPAAEADTATVATSRRELEGASS